MFYTCLKCYETVNKRELKLLVEVVVFEGIDNIIVVKRFSHLDHWDLGSCRWDLVSRPRNQITGLGKEEDVLT